MHDQKTWIFEEDTFPDSVAVGAHETLFSLGNGRLGFRGDTEYRAPAFQRGTYIYGMYEREPIIYGEDTFGQATDHQTILNLPDGRRIDLLVNGTAWTPTAQETLSWSRALDMRQGTVTRKSTHRLADGTLLTETAVRLVSFHNPALGAIRVEITVDRPVDLEIHSVLDLTVHNFQAKDDPRVGSKFQAPPLKIATQGRDGEDQWAIVATDNSRLQVGCAVRTSVQLDGHVHPDDSAPSDSSLCYRLKLSPGKTVRIEKYLAYLGPYGQDPAAVPTYYSRDSGQKNPVEPAPHQLEADLKKLVQQAAHMGVDHLLREQAEFLEKFWHSADIEIEGPASIQQAVRFSMFHLLQSSGSDGYCNLAAKGLTGEGYEGHYFWDTEIYTLPFFTYVRPPQAQALLNSRRRLLGASVDRAAELHHQGALFAWRTINGREASAYFPAGTAQYHINADIAYAIERYVRVTGDQQWHQESALPLLVETARFWMSLGAFIPSRGNAFCIHTVTGPDEYSALVNNNVYTNVMVRRHLRQAARLARSAMSEPERLKAALSGRTMPSAEEIEQWLAAADAMSIPYDAERGLYAQDESFLGRPVWDFAGTPEDHYPLLLHYHPLEIYRHQVLKQPDLLLAMFLLRHDFTRGDLIRAWEYYEPLTTGDSSLSHCIMGILASELGHSAKAWEFFQQTVRLDIDDMHNNTRDGIHAANMAGSWMSIVYGFLGLRDDGDLIGFDPCLPDQFKRLKLRLHIKSTILHIDIEPAAITYRLETGEELQFAHRNRPLRLTIQAPVVRCALMGPPELVLHDNDVAHLSADGVRQIDELLALATARGLHHRDVAYAGTNADIALAAKRAGFSIVTPGSNS